MRPILTVSSVVLLHLCVIAVLVGVNGCRSTSGFEKDPDLAAYSAGSRTSASALSSVAPQPVTAGPGGVHVAVKGETLQLVAARERVALKDLAAANGLPLNAALKAGQRLKIPAAKPAKSKSSQK
ncbi:MAG: LysM domain-containing protein [Opitutales bacterium]|nr:LysM domain-containing protein [Opitutales bacterium]